MLFASVSRANGAFWWINVFLSTSFEKLESSWFFNFRFLRTSIMSRQRFCQEKDEWQERKFGGRNGRPPHLKGREIGFYYARMGKKKRAIKDLQQRSAVTMDYENEQKIEDLLKKIKDNTHLSKDFENSDQYLASLNAGSSSSFQFFDDLESEYSQACHPSVCSLTPIPSLDAYLIQESKKRSTDSKFLDMLNFRKKLPSFNMRQEIVDFIESNQVAVISGETGCGKTTQVTQFILDHYIESGKGSLCKIVCTQPRRISAISVAERVAQERTEPCGRSSVGYQIRLESKLPRDQGSILYCTTGIVLQRLQNDPWLAKTSHIILDEIHERDLQSDFLLIILKDLRIHRPDLKIILMSATLNADLFSKYFGNCPMMKIPGFTFPVTEYLLEDVLEITGYIPPNQNQCSSRPFLKWKRHTRQGRELVKQIEEHDQYMEPYFKSLEGKYSMKTIQTLRNWDEENIDLGLIVSLLKYIVNTQEDGAILIFLPGWEQISKLHKVFTSDSMFNSSRFLLIPLHSLMPTVNQKKVFNRPPPGVRKIIIATNIAETSITIDDVVYVIDCGKIKTTKYDEDADLNTLKPEWIAIANAHQRRGRAGRVQPGVCYHLYTKAREMLFSAYQLPEMLRTRLETLCLKIKILKLGKIQPFIAKAMERPSSVVLEKSIALLQTLNALDENENLTPLGYHLANLPLDPHTGKMILFGAMFSCLDPVCTVAASLSFKDAFVIPLGKEPNADARKKILSQNSCSDHLMLIYAFQGWEQAKLEGYEREYCWENFLSSNTLKMLSNLKKQYAEYLMSLKFLHCANPGHEDFNINSGNEKLIKAIICAGLYPKVAKVIPQNKQVKKFNRPVTVITNEDGRVYLHPKSVNSTQRNFQTQWLIYHQKVRSSQIFLHDTTVVNPYPLLFFGGNISSHIENGQETVSVDEWIKFYCSKRTAVVVQELRDELDNLLKYKIKNPGVTCWDISSNEGALLNAVIQLITSEEPLRALDIGGHHYEDDYDQAEEF